MAAASDGGADVVGADDVGPGEDGGYVGGGGGVETVFHGGWAAVEKERQRGIWVRVWARKPLREAPVRMGRLNWRSCSRWARRG